MKTGMALAALAAVLLLATAHQAAASRELKASVVSCPAMKCPSGFIAQKACDTSCGYECYTQAKLNCPPSLASPIVCGGTTGKPCPSIACAYSSTYAISGPTGCASAKSTIQAIAISNATFNNPAGLMQQVIVDYCSTPDTSTLSATASQVANAYATVVATTLTQYSTYVCSCCTGNGAAYAVVAADVQAVATAQAYAWQTLLATVSDCYGNLLSGAAAYAEAFAEDVQLAINSVYKPAYSQSGKGCTSGALKTQLTSAIAQATVCTFANIFAAAIDAQTAGISYACATSLSVSGVGAITSCPININCPCTPAGYQYNNLGFEQGTFDAGDGSTNPVWNVVDNGNTAPYVSTQEVIASGMVVNPEEGDYFAVIPSASPAGSPSSISTSFIVPPCASSISASYIFACGDYYPYTDKASLSITVTDNYNTTNVIAPVNINVDCSTTGDFGATNNGQWTTVNIPVSYGSYSVSVSATSQNKLDDILPSKMLVDNITFA